MKNWFRLCLFLLTLKWVVNTPIRKYLKSHELISVPRYILFKSGRLHIFLQMMKNLPERKKLCKVLWNFRWPSSHRHAARRPSSPRVDLCYPVALHSVTPSALYTSVAFIFLSGINWLIRAFPHPLSLRKCYHAWCELS